MTRPQSIDPELRDAMAAVFTPTPLDLLGMFHKPVGVTPDGQWTFEDRLLFRGADGQLCEINPIHKETSDVA